MPGTSERGQNRLLMKSLYSKESIELMRSAESSSDFQSNRIEIIRTFAQKTGYQRIGIANCITFGNETAILREFLLKDFEVFCVDCKFGNLKEQDLFGGTSRRILCNPAGQAEYLNQKGTDLNLSIGLCVGHDMIFNMVSEAPVTTLFSKDFTNGHNPAKAISEIGRNL